MGSTDRFYIYEWPDLVNRYANFTDRPVHGHGVEFPQWKLNYGAGRLINPDSSEYKTSQFALFKLMYERALIDPRRTLNPADATSFFIPYDFGMDATFFEQHGRMRKTNCPLAQSALDRLRNSPYFQANQGHDHLLIVSVNQNMNFFFNARSCMDVFQTCWNCTKLAIDEYMFIGRDRNFELPRRGINWHAVPFPADYHYDASKRIIHPWERSDTQEYQQRTIVVSFMGNARKYSVVNTQIREALIIQCRKHEDICHHGAYQHDAKISGPNDVSRKAVFCLQPPGDMPTRKSVFDSILSGCIPVLFHPLTARYMYEWHLGGQQGWEEIAINFDSVGENDALIKQKVDFIEKLERIYKTQPEIIKQKRDSIRRLAHQLQYSLILKVDGRKPPVASIKKVKQPKGGYRIISDAYDISMTKVLQIHSGKVPHNRTAEYLICDTLRSGRSRPQTADHCRKTNSTMDPFGPPYAVESPLYAARESRRSSS